MKQRTMEKNTELKIPAHDGCTTHQEQQREPGWRANKPQTTQNNTWGCVKPINVASVG